MDSRAFAIRRHNSELVYLEQDVTSLGILTEKAFTEEHIET